MIKTDATVRDRSVRSNHESFMISPNARRLRQITFSNHRIGSSGVETRSPDALPIPASVLLTGMRSVPQVRILIMDHPSSASGLSS